MEILFSFVGTCLRRVRNLRRERKKIATDSLVLQIFEMDFALAKFAKIAQKNCEFIKKNFVKDSETLTKLMCEKLFAMWQKLFYFFSKTSSTIPNSLASVEVIQ